MLTIDDQPSFILTHSEDGEGLDLLQVTYAYTFGKQCIPVTTSSFLYEPVPHLGLAHGCIDIPGQVIGQAIDIRFKNIFTQSICLEIHMQVKKRKRGCHQASICRQYISPVSNDRHILEIQAVSHIPPMVTFHDGDLCRLVKEHTCHAYHRKRDDINTDQ